MGHFRFPQSIADQVRQIIHLITWANLQDSDRVPSPQFPKLASQRGCYGHLQNALLAIVAENTSPAVSVLVAAELGEIFSNICPGIQDLEECIERCR